MKTLFLSCKKATELIEKRSVRSLSLKERIQLRCHLNMCEACVVYEKYSKKINKILQEWFSDDSQTELPVIKNPELKERINNKL